MNDVICAWCSQPWDVQGLRHEGWGYITDPQAPVLGVLASQARANTGDQEARRHVSQQVYLSTMSGRGCPYCGYRHPSNMAGPFRQEQLRQIVVDGVTDDAPELFF